MKDRFSDATAELSTKNPYLCDSCTTTFGHPTIERFDDMTHREMSTRGADCILNCDPMPFGD